MIEHQSTPGWVAVENFLSDAVVRPDRSLKRAVTSALEAVSYTHLTLPTILLV